MERKHKKIFTEYLPQFVEQVNPQQLLIYLPCISTYNKETVDTAQTSKSRSYAAQVLHGHLERRPEGFEQLVKALRHESVGCDKLADLLDPQHKYDPDDEGQKPGLNNNVSVPANHHGDNKIHDNVQLPTRCTPSSEGTHGNHNRRTNPGGDHIRPQAKYKLSTPWEKLPGGVIPILKKFDAEQSIKKIEDLGDLLGFNVEEIGEIEAAVKPGESKTLAFLHCWMQKQQSHVTLQKILEIFKQLDRLDIVHDLQNKTGVVFGQEDENGNQANNSSVHHDELAGQARKESDFTDKIPKMDLPSVKASDKIIKNYNIKPSAMPQLNPENNDRVRAETCMQLPQNNSDILETSRPQSKRDFLSIADDSIEECKKHEKIIRYKKEDIEKRRNHDFKTFTEDVQGDSKKKIDHVLYSRKLSGELSTGPEIRDSSPITCNGDIDSIENNLNRSVSSTENNSYDSIQDTIFENNLQSGIERRPFNPQASNNIVKDEDKLDNAESNFSLSADDYLDDKSSTLEKEKKTEKLLEGIEIDGPLDNFLQQKNRWQKKFSSQNDDNDAEKLLASFSKAMFEQKISKGVQNYCDVFSQNDPSELSNFSEKILSGQNLVIKRRQFDSSILNVDHSLLDEEANKPKLASLSGEMKSLEKKAFKAYPGQHQPGEAIGDTESCWNDDPTGSFQFYWQMSTPQSEDLQTDGENELKQPEQTSLRNCESESLLYQPLDTENEAEFTKRGPASKILSKTKNQKIEYGNLNGNVLKESVADHYKRHSQPNFKSTDRINTNENIKCKGLITTASHDTIKKTPDVTEFEALRNNELGVAFCRNETESCKRNMIEDASQSPRDSKAIRRSGLNINEKMFCLKSACTLVKVVYDNCI